MLLLLYHAVAIHLEVFQPESGICIHSISLIKNDARHSYHIYIYSLVSIHHWSFIFVDHVCTPTLDQCTEKKLSDLLKKGPDIKCFAWISVPVLGVSFLNIDTFLICIEAMCFVEGRTSFVLCLPSLMLTSCNDFFRSFLNYCIHPQGTSVASIFL